MSLEMIYRLGMTYLNTFPNLPSDLFLNLFGIGLKEKVEKSAAEVVGMRIWIAQLVGDGIEQEIFA
jgi:hypothetical protein